MSTIPIREAGEQATFDVGVHGIHPEIIKLIGRLKYRTSYGQNVLQHSLEVAFLCGVMASELGLNVKQAKRAGLLHDLGKAVDHEIEGSHAVIGADIARKYGENRRKSSMPLPRITKTKSRNRSWPCWCRRPMPSPVPVPAPGARCWRPMSSVLQDLERIGTSFAGVTSCYAIQAGREIRIMVSSERGLRRAVACSGQRYCPQNRERDDLSRSDQGQRHSRNSRH